VPNWSACFLGGIQPDAIRRVAKDAVEDGLLQRFMFAVPGEQREGADRRPDSKAIGRYAALFRALVVKQPHGWSEHFNDPQVVRLHDDAQAYRVEVERVCAAIALVPDTSTRLQAALRKAPGIFGRLCLVFHLINIVDAALRGEPSSTDELTVPVATIRATAALVLDVVVPHMLRADAVMYDTVQTGHARWIAHYILAHRLERITVRNVQRDYSPLRSPEMRRHLEAAMGSLVDAGWLREVFPKQQRQGVREWRVNPEVHGVFAERAEQEAARREMVRAEIAATVAARRART